MRLFHHSVKSRLIVCLGLCVMLLIAIGVLGVHGMRSAKNDLQTVYERNVSAMRLLSTLNAQVLDIRGRILNVAALRSYKEVPELAKVATSYKDSMANVWTSYYPDKISTPEEREIADRFNDQYAGLSKGIDQLVNYMKRGAFDAVIDIYNDQVRSQFQDARSALYHLIELSAKNTQLTYERGLARYRLERNVIIGVIGGASLLIVLLIVGLIRSILAPLGKANALAASIAAGRLDNVLVIKQRDEFGTMLRNMQDMQQKLAMIVHDVRINAEAVGVATQQIAQGNDDLSRRTQEQAANLEQTAASMEEMTTTVKQNADNALEANQLTVSVRQQAQQGSGVVTETIAAMEAISASSDKISEIVGMIDTIAFQTNLLALNAAVEAARAGEQGRGFAVVAGEVRQLASRSASAAKEIKQLVQESAARVHSGSALVTQSGKTLDEIVNGIQRVASIVNEITVSSQEQASGIEQVNLAVSQMDAMTQQNAGLVEQAAAASRSLEDQAHALRERMAFFQIAPGNGGTTAAPALMPVQPAHGGATGSAENAKRRIAPAASPAARRKHSEPAARVSADEWQTF